MIAHLAGRARDHAALRWLIEGTTKLSMMLFVPASLVVLIAGILLAIDGPWSFGELWTVLGLIGYAATLEREGMTPAAKGEIHHMLVLSRLDYVTLTLVIAVMALKRPRATMSPC
jgi:hypothetical protein